MKATHFDNEHALREAWRTLESDPTGAIDLCRGVLDAGGEGFDGSAVKADAECLLGTAYLVSGEVQLALKTLLLIDTSGYEDVAARTFNAIGAALSNLDDFKGSLDAYQNSLTLRRSLKDEKGEATVLANLACALSKMGDDRAALDAFAQSNAIFSRLGDHGGRGTGLVNASLSLLRLDELESALKVVQEGLDCLAKVDRPARTCHALTQLCELQHRLGRTKAANIAGERALELANQLGNADLKNGSKRAVAGLLMPPNVGADLERCLALLQDALADAQENQLAKADTHLELSNAYGAAGQHELALRHHRIYARMSKNAFAQMAANQLAAARVKFETETAQRETRQLADRNRALTRANHQLSDLHAALARADHERRTWLTTLSRQVRGPLTAIRTTTELLAIDPGYAADDPQVAVNLRDQAASVMRSLQQLLDAHQTVPSAGNQVVAVDLGAVAEGVVRARQTSAVHQGASLSLTLPSALRATGWGDPDTIAKAIDDLVVHALMDTQRQGPVQITVGTERGSPFVCVDAPPSGARPSVAHFLLISQGGNLEPVTGDGGHTRWMATFATPPSLRE